MLKLHVAVEPAVRWTARILSLFSVYMLLLFLFGEPFEITKIRAIEWVGLMLFPVGVVAGFAVGWWKEGLGGAISVGSLLVFYFLFVFRPGDPVRGIWFFVFAFPGFLFLTSWGLSRGRRALTL
jgi:hypothetical protein